MRIAICDDEDQERLNIEALVKRYAPELSIVFFPQQTTAGSSEDRHFSHCFSGY